MERFSSRVWYAVVTKTHASYALLARLAGQDVEPAEGSDGTDGRWRIARRVARGRTISVVDPQARHAHKSQSVLRYGHKDRIEGEPETGQFTNAVLTRAGGSGSGDAEAGITAGHGSSYTHHH